MSQPPGLRNLLPRAGKNHAIRGTLVVARNEREFVV